MFFWHCSDFSSISLSSIDALFAHVISFPFSRLSMKKNNSYHHLDGRSNSFRFHFFLVRFAFRSLKIRLYFRFWRIKVSSTADLINRCQKVWFCASNPTEPSKCSVSWTSFGSERKKRCIQWMSTFSCKGLYLVLIANKNVHWTCSWTHLSNLLSTVVRDHWLNLSIGFGLSLRSPF